MPTRTISSTWPRTYAPSFASISSQVSRTFFRRACGRSEQTSSSARSRSKIQYAAHASMKKMPSVTSNTVSVTGHRRVDEALAGRQILEASLKSDEDVVPDPGFAARLLAEVGAGLRQGLDRLVHLIDRTRHDRPEQAREEPDA